MKKHTHAPTGKIARMPAAVREEINRRLDDGIPVRNILAWINSLPSVRAILKEHFKSVPVREQNVSEWRKRGFVEWLDRNTPGSRAEASQQLRLLATLDQLCTTLEALCARLKPRKVGKGKAAN